MKYLLITAIITSQTFIYGADLSTKALLGEAFFNDTSFSQNRTMSCATCHNPQQAFIDTRVNHLASAVSIGDDGTSIGDRNSPSIGYASFTPTFSQDGRIRGGLFFDGRATDLTEQAKGPFLNPIEMNMPSEASVIARLQENQEYITAMQSFYGANIFNNTSNAYTALADAIATFERTSIFAPFDSDRDTNTLSASALRGKTLFRANNCVRCHDDRGSALFTDFTYSNLGIPINTAVRALNNHATDLGLSENPAINNRREEGNFKVPTLRNIAVTAPYMHNGVFATLKAVVHFYNTRDSGGINPETGQAWRSPEVARGLERNDIGNLGLTDREENDIVAFLESLTDAQYKSSSVDKKTVGALIGVYSILL
ncbi:Cytochrome c551 peroxidase [hydrothermal vent metagenome]|uniref:Cytochrome c551 peroxidase n=1 Tax=hydrothermal vent metagenome TaxID=652676 RepID=A0A1W1D1P2_9ZZZZ